ncbi:metallophosphoesterase [Aggregatilinea lenta]|uniref:metallophosphoesterase n=1 Tax=Aggregatilinea lenta TaxID=913108 RepID=UPI000E5B2BEF|nr:metallophosphoesterase [Aggregatilinea lenta]
MQPKLTFVQISDSHLGPTRDFEKHGVRPYDCLQRFITLFNDAPLQPDFLLHSGDVSDDGSPASYALASELFAQINVPVYFVNGNHDSVATLRRLMDANATAHSGNPDAPLSYTFDLKDERFLVLDAFSETVPQPLGFMSEAQIAFLRAETESGTLPLTVFVHYPPFEMGSPWLDEHMPITNGEDLHQALLPARDRLRGVFGGHLHRPCQTTRNGITYCTTASVAFQYTWHGWEDLPIYDPATPSGYLVTRYFDRHVVATHYSF